MSDAPDPLFHQQILASCARFKDVIALVGENGEKVSFEDIRRAAHSFARRLSAIGIEKGDVVLVCLPNSPWYPVLFLSTALLGAVMSGVNFESTKDELKFFIEASQPTVFISTTDFITEHDWLSELVTTKGIQGRVIDSVFENAADCEPVPLSPDDPVLAPFSSGTTGAPKCCLLTHRNFVFATQSLRTALFDKVLEQSSGRTLAFLPFHHASGFWALLMSLIGGCTTYIMTKFHPILMLDMIDKFEIDTVNMVPAVVRILLRMDIENRGMSLRTILCGSSALPKQTCERFLQQFPLVERFLQGYGMTELVVLSHITPIDDHLQHLGSCGKLIPGFEAKVCSLRCSKLVCDAAKVQIMSDAGEEIFQPNIEGHLLLRSEAIMKFYKDGTPNLDGDDWLHTGDVAMRDDDDFFYITDRFKDLIKVNGEQVSPSEIENVIHEHKDVVESAVIGVVDEHSGELPKAFVVLKEDVNVEAAVRELIKLLKEKLSPSKQPRGGIKIVNLLPKSATGKVKRAELRSHDD